MLCVLKHKYKYDINLSTTCPMGRKLQSANKHRKNQNVGFQEEWEVKHRDRIIYGQEWLKVMTCYKFVDIMLQICARAEYS
jgi:hypothetical protein